VLAAVHGGRDEILRDDIDHSARVDEHKRQRVRLRSAAVVATNCGEADLSAGGDRTRQVWRGEARRVAR